MSNVKQPRLDERGAETDLRELQQWRNFIYRGVSKTGFIHMYGGPSVPPGGWLLCDGTAVSRIGYANLFAVIGTAYGTGDGSTTFNVPDLRGRVPLGVGTGLGGGASGTGLPAAGDALTAVSRGTWKGAETHVLVAGELPTTAVQGTGSVTVDVTVPTVAVGAVNTALGSGTAHNNLQPVMGLNFIIKT